MEAKNRSAHLFRWQYVIALVGVMIAAVAVFTQWVSHPSSGTSSTNISNNCGSAVITGSATNVQVSDDGCKR
jgi:hypothetical protein